MSHSSATRRYFDGRAQDLRRENLVDKWAAVAPLLDGLGPDAHILECGAGTGLYTLPMLRAGHHVTAVDLSSACLDELARAADDAGLADQLETFHGDFIDVVDAVRDVDAVTFIKVLHHFPDQRSIAAAIRASWSALAPGGRIVVFEPNGLSPMWPILFRLRGREVWEAERNTRLIRHDFLERVFGSLPGARLRAGYRYLIPGTIAARRPQLDRLDRRLTRVPGLRAVAGNLWLAAHR